MKKQAHNHLLGIYSEDVIFREALSYLKDGWHNNETLMLITDCMSRQQLLDTIRFSWGVGDLGDDDRIIVKSVHEWYFKQNDNLDPKRIYKQWNDIVKGAKIKKRNGVRVFADVRGFFDFSKHRDLLDYEKTLPERFEFPLSAICAYTDKLIERIGRRQFRDLRNHHGKIIYKFEGKGGSGKPSPVSGVMKKVILDAVNDASKMEMLLLFMNNTTTATAISKRLKLPKTSCYRKINELVRDGLVIEKENKGHAKYRATYSGISIIVKNGTIDITVS